jgi:hypothetical protein
MLRQPKAAAIKFRSREDHTFVGRLLQRVRSAPAGNACGNLCLTIMSSILASSSMIRPIGRAFTIFALCLAIGLHWAALQSIAWTTMLVAYSKQTTLNQAVARTFDGDHPCDLCKRISSTQHSQKKPQAQPSPTKPDLICTARFIRIMRLFQNFPYAESAVHFFERGQSPPVPPPRASLA